MKKVIYLAASLVFIGNINAQETVKKNLGDFNAIDIRSAARINLFQSDSCYILLSPKEPSAKLPKMQVSDGSLEINSSFHGTIDIYVKNITSIRVSNAARVESKDTLKASDLTVHVSDAGRADIWVNAKFIRAKANDAGSITFSGSTDSLDARVSDASHVNSFYLRADHVKANSSDGSNASVYAIKSIEARATDGSTVDIKGTPAQRDISASDGGSVKMDDTGDETTQDNWSGDNRLIKMGKDSNGKKQMVITGDVFIGGGFVLGGSNGTAIKYGSSREFMVGFGGGHMLTKWNELGLDVYYKSTGYFLQQDSGKSFPDAARHEAQKISFQNFGGLVYDRFFFGHNIFLDGGVYGDWTFHNKIVDWDNNSPDVSSTKTTYRNLGFVNPTNYGVSVRFGSTKGLSLYFNYRLSKLFQTPAAPGIAYPQLPVYVIGVNIGGF